MIAYGFPEDIKGYISTVKVAYRSINGVACWVIKNQKGLGEILGIEKPADTSGTSAVGTLRSQITKSGIVIHEDSTGMKEVNAKQQNVLFEREDSELIICDPSGEVKITDPSNSNEKPMPAQDVLDLKRSEEDGIRRNKVYHDARIKANGQPVYEVVQFIDDKKTSTVTKTAVGGPNGVVKVIDGRTEIICKACKEAREKAQRGIKLPAVIKGNNSASHKRWEITYKVAM